MESGHIQRVRVDRYIYWTQKTKLLTMSSNLTLAFYLTFLFSCNTTKPISENYQIRCEKTSNEATYTVAVSYQSNSDYTDIETVKQNALDGILFRGITGTNECVAQKPLLNRDKSEVSNTTFYKQLYGKKRYYNKYITNLSKLKDEPLESIKMKTVYQHNRLVTINKELLRKDLVAAGLLKQINAGF